MGQQRLCTVYILTWLVLFLAGCCDAGENIKIGGLFDQANEESELVFKYAVDAINNERFDNSKRLEAHTMKVPFGNVFAVSKKLCRMLRSGVAAIFGPSSPAARHHVQSVCDAKEMPHIDTNWDASTQLPVLNMHPYSNTMGNVLLELIKQSNWKSFTVLYESSLWLPRVANLLEMYDPKGYTVTVKQLDLGLNANYRPVLRNVKLSEDRFIIIDCSIESLEEVLKQALQVGLLTDHHQFIITNMDMHTIDLEPYLWTGANITGIRLVDPDDKLVEQVTNFWDSQQQAANQETPPGLTAKQLRVETALLYDGVLLFAEALKHLNGTHQMKPPQLHCDDTTTWRNGYSIINFMKTLSVRGLTGDIKFDHKGDRTDFRLEIIEVDMSGVHKIGTWNSTGELSITRHMKTAMAIDDGTLRNRTFFVLTALSPPYGMLKDSAMKLTGNDRFEGFGIDLINELSIMLGFNYTFMLQEDGVYGSLNRDTGTWNGMIRQLLDGHADLAITDLTITSDRESAVDFTMPFMNLGISILYRKPTKEPPSLFSFMSPFSNEVWLYLGAAYMGVSFCLFLLGRISPSEWDNPFPCIEEPEVLENQFSFRNSMWFTIGALLQQGSEIAPKAPSTRIVASIWWFFTLIMVSSYTANLAAFLTVESISSPIDNAEDLANSNGAVKYGAKRDGSTISFFKDAEYAVYQKMYKYMMDHPDLLTSSNPEGLSRVKSENYAFLMESTSIEYLTERECDVTQIGSLLDDKGYGIAMRKNSLYRSALSEAVLRLQEQGVLTALKIKWWKEKRGGGACSATDDESGALALEVANVGGVFVLLMLGAVFGVFISLLEMVVDVNRRAKEGKKGKSDDDGAAELGMPNVGGVFFVLLVGATLASFLGLCEWCYNVMRRAHEFKVTFREELMEELRFVGKCHGNTKTVRHRKSSSQDSRDSQQSTKTGHDIEQEAAYKWSEIAAQQQRDKNSHSHE